MKKRWVPILVLILALLLAPSLVFANGFGINEIDTKAFAMGGAFVAQADNPSAVYFNPAGIVQLDGIQATAGGALIIPHGTFKSNGTSIYGRAGERTDTEDQIFFIPNLFVTYKMNDKISFGLGEFTNFGLANEYPEDWEGRFITGGVLAALETISFGPVIAYQPFERLSIGGGFAVQHLNIELNHVVSVGGPEADVELTGDNWSYGWNIGLLFWLTDELKFGLSYRSQMDHEIEGEVVVKLSQIGLANEKRDADADLTLPDILYIGLAWSRGPFTVELDGQFTRWSTYDTLAAVFDEPIFGATELSSDKDWEDVWAVRFGVEYRMTPELALRGGIIFDEAPMPDATFDPLVPSGDRWLFGLGCGYTIGKFVIDFGYNFLLDEEREFNNEAGDYNEIVGPGAGQMTGEFEDVYSHLIMLSGSYRF